MNRTRERALAYLEPLAGSGWLFGAQLVALACGLVSITVLARVLGPSGTGTYAVAMLVPALIALVLGGGLSAANVYFTGAGRIAVPSLVANSLMVMVVATGIGALVLLVLETAGAVQLVLPGLSTAVLVVAVIAAAPTIARQSFTAVLLGLQWFAKSAQVDATQAVVSLAVTLLIVVALGAGPGGAVVGYALGVLAAAALGLWWLRPKLVGQRLRSDVSVARRTVGYGYRATAGVIAQLLTYRLDLLLVNAWIGTAAAGQYAVASRLAELLWVLPTAVGSVIFSRSASMHSGQMNAVTPRAFLVTLTLSAVAALILAATARWLLPIVVTSQFDGAVDPMLILLPGAVLLGSSGILANDIAGRGRPGTVSLIAFVTCGVTIALDVALIPSWGIIGAAFASTLAYTVYFVLIGIAYIRIANGNHKKAPGLDPVHQP